MPYFRWYEDNREENSFIFKHVNDKQKYIFITNGKELLLVMRVPFVSGHVVIANLYNYLSPLPIRYPLCSQQAPQLLLAACNHGWWVNPYFILERSAPQQSCLDWVVVLHQLQTQGTIFNFIKQSDVLWEEKVIMPPVD